MFNKPTIMWGVMHTDVPYADPNWISEGAWIQLYRQYSSIPNIELRRSEKWIGLKSLGIDDEQIERMCKPKEYTREEIDAEVAKLSLNNNGNSKSGTNNDERKKGNYTITRPIVINLESKSLYKVKLIV